MSGVLTRKKNGLRVVLSVDLIRRALQLRLPWMRSNSVLTSAVLRTELPSSRGIRLVKNRPGKSVTEVRIVEAAVQLFSRHGYKGTSTRDISCLAEVNEVTLFRYFPRKTELFLGCR